MLILMFTFVKPNFSKKIDILGGKSKYETSILGRDYEGLRYHNVKMEIAICLCEKYLEFELNEFVQNISIKTICDKRKDIFSNWYHL